MRDFKPFTTHHDLGNALALAKAANLAYENRVAIESTASNWDLTRCEFIDHDGTQCFVAADDEVVLVAFRGTQTEELEDIVTDARIRLVHGALDGRVHRGFQQAFELVWADVERAVNTFQDQGQALWITGHSLGAAIATLAAAQWIDAGKPFNGLYNFGSPRVGNRAFRRDYNGEARDRTFRYVNNHDLVTRVPPRSLKYRHVGTLKYFDGQGRLRDDSSAWNQFVERVAVAVEDFKSAAKAGIADHSMDRYLERIQAVIDNPDNAERPDLLDRAGSVLRSFGSLFGGS